MPAWIYVLAACAIGFVLWVLAARYHPFRRGAHAAPRALPVRVDAGSMVLAEERTAWLSAPPWEPTDGCVVPSSPKSGPRPMTAGTVRAAPAMKTGIGTPYGGQLGPRARAVLDRYNARCVERLGHAITG